jgi:signal transduction histidine kinase
VLVVLTALRSPWHRLRAVRVLGFVVLDLVVMAVTFPVVAVLVAGTIGFASSIIAAPVGVVLAWLASMAAAGIGRVERSRASALLDLHVAAPHRPLEGSFWRRLLQRATTASRWRELFYVGIQPLTSSLAFSLVVSAWAGSLALALLPAYLRALPDERARFWLFDVTTVPSSLAVAGVGVVGLVLVAPWITLGVGALLGRLVRGLLGPGAEAAFEAQVTELQASRTAAVDTAESERRRIERDLHDGAQQRLVALAMDLGMAQDRFDTDPEGARQLVAEAHQEAKAALAELRDLVRGFQPAILTDRGLDAALSPVVARLPIPVVLDVRIDHRPSTVVESAAYFIVVEALTNVAKHAEASRATVTVERATGRLAIAVTDDGRGGADASFGTGLAGLEERVRSLGGRMQLISPVGGPTSLFVELPCAS